MNIFKLLTTWTIAANGSVRFAFRDLDVKINNRVAYLTRIILRPIMTPTFTTQPGVVGHNKLFKQIRVLPYGGQIARGILSGNGLRMFERLEAGRHVDAEAIQTASASPRHWQRAFSFGPASHERPDEFAIPCSAMADGSIEADFGALTDISADTTVLTGTVQVIGEYVLRDELVIPPCYERREDVVSQGDQLSGESLIVNMALCKSTAFGAFSAGDVGNVTIEAGTFNPVNGVPAQVLAAAFRRAFAVGELSGVQGDPNDATDVHQRQINLASPTAIAAQTADFQPIMFAPPNHKISKLPVWVRSSIKTSWTGAATSSVVRLTGRILPQSESTVGMLADKAASLLGMSVGAPKVKTLSKEVYKGPYRQFLGSSGKLGR